MGEWAAILAWLGVLAVVGEAALLFAPPLMAAEPGRVARAPVPTPPKGRGDNCVAETPYMRRYHMVLLNHKRDETVHEGIRTKRFSLRGCVECHSVKDSENRAVTYDNPAHFCRGCHDYAAVKIDCFECHASRPEKAAGTTDMPGSSVLALKAYLGGVRR